MYCLVELGVENVSSTRGRILTFYKENFEKHFFRETEDYFQKESAEFLSKNTVTKYVGKVIIVASSNYGYFLVYLGGL